MGKKGPFIEFLLFLFPLKDPVGQFLAFFVRKKILTIVGFELVADSNERNKALNRKMNLKLKQFIKIIGFRQPKFPGNLSISNHGNAFTKNECKRFDSGRTRTYNLLLRRQAPYPLGHRALVPGDHFFKHTSVHI